MLRIFQPEGDRILHEKCYFIPLLRLVELYCPKNPNKYLLTGLYDCFIMVFYKLQLSQQVRNVATSEDEHFQLVSQLVIAYLKQWQMRVRKQFFQYLEIENATQMNCVTEERLSMMLRIFVCQKSLLVLPLLRYAAYCLLRKGHVFPEVTTFIIVLLSSTYAFCLLFDSFTSILNDSETSLCCFCSDGSATVSTVAYVYRNSEPRIICLCFVLLLQMLIVVFPVLLISEPH